MVSNSSSCFVFSRAASHFSSCIGPLDHLTSEREATGLRIVEVLTFHSAPGRLSPTPAVPLETNHTYSHTVIILIHVMTFRIGSTHEGYVFGSVTALHCPSAYSANREAAVTPAIPAPAAASVVPPVPAVITCNKKSVRFLGGGGRKANTTRLP